MGDTVRTAQGRTDIEQRSLVHFFFPFSFFLSPFLYPGYKEWDRGLAGHLLIG